jgi:hypothetical protein
MARRPSEGPDLKLADELAFAPRGLDLQRIAETAAGPTPDFRVTRGSELVAFCEVKSPRDDWFDEQLAGAAGAQFGQLVGGGRKDPTFNRLARHIEKASTQFDAVNGSHAVPNILVFVNHADESDWRDLWETVTGTFYVENGKRYVTMAHISEGRIAQAKQEVDLYLWIDARTRQLQLCLFNEAYPDNVRKLCDLGWILPEGKRGTTKANTVTQCEADLEAAWRAQVVAREANVPFEEMTIYDGRVTNCRDALAEASRPPRSDPPCNTVIIFG